MNQDKSEKEVKADRKERAPRQRRERQNKDDLSEERNFKDYATGEMEKVLVKPDTEVPPVPAKNERLKKPDEDAFHDTLDKMDDQKEKLWDEFKKYAKEVRQSAYNSTKKDGQTTNLFTSLKEKQAVRKELRTEMNKLKEASDAQKAQLDALEDKKASLRSKMKKHMKAEELESLLADMKYEQANGHMSLYDEKQLIKQIQDLEDSLPFARPLEELELKRAPLKKEKDELGKKKKAKWEQIQALNKEIDELSGEFDLIKKNQKDTFESMDPAIEKAKAKVTEESDAIKEAKKKVIKEYRQACRDYDIQQQVIRKLEWMNQAKTRLVKFKAQLEEEEAERKQQEEERKELQDNVYSEEIRLCQFLIRYCQTFQKKEAVQAVKEEAPRDTSCLNDEKLQVVQRKKDQNVDFHKGKGKKAHKKAAPQETKPEDNKISHKLDVLEYFEQMRMVAPTRNKIDETIKLLQEKEKYYVEQNEIKKQENVDVIEEEKKKIRDRENEVKKRQNNQPKKNKKKNAEFKDEEYPEM